MVAVRKYLPGFLAGEIDPLLSGRTETDHYAYGLETCENFVPTNEGPIVKRPGFEYICDAADSATWLTPFRFSVSQEYALEWSDGAVRFFTNGGRIETGGDPYAVTVPYGASQAPLLSYQQSFDRLYIDHGSHPPGALSRTGAATFSYAVQALENGPFKDANTDETVTVQASAASGAGILLTASDDIFDSAQVGALFRLEAKDFASTKSWEAGMKGIAINDLCRSEGKVYKALTAGTTGTNPPVHSEGAEWDGLLRADINDDGPYGVQWEYVHDRFGIVRISSFTAADEVYADVLRRLPDQVVTDPTWRWAHAAFSALEGWPSLVAHWQGRQIHVKDFDLFGSVVGDYAGGRVNFREFTSSGTLAADLAFRRRMAIADLPHWIAVDNRKLLLGTPTGEHAIGAVNASQAVSGENIGLEPQSFYGSEQVTPAQLGTETVFVERGGRRLRAGDFDISSDRYVPADLTAAARHITKSGIVQLAHQRVPYRILYAVRGDGQIVVHPLTRLEVKGFGRIKLGGDARALSAVSIVGADGKTDELWLLVERTRADGTAREIWKQSGWRELGDAREAAFFVDCGTQVTLAAGTTALTGFDHLAGQAVAVLAAGGVVPNLTVAEDGTLTLPAIAVPQDREFTVTVGLGYTALAVTLRPEANTRNGTIQGLFMRLRKVVLRVLETVGVLVGDSAAEEYFDTVDPPMTGQMDAPVPLYTGDTEGAVDADITDDGRTRFVSSDPLPAMIAATILSIEVDELDA